MRPVGGKIKKQEREVEMIRLVKLKEIQEPLAFEHSTMLKDFVNTSNARAH